MHHTTWFFLYVTGGAFAWFVAALAWAMWPVKGRDGGK